MPEPILELRNVSVMADDTPILHDVSLTVAEGEVHVLLGPNGSGKSSVLAAVMGLPPFQKTAGAVFFRGKDISDLATDARAQLGLGLAFQRPPSLPGVTVGDFAEALGAAGTLAEEAAALDLDEFANRDLVTGFSGGEIKRWEVLKLFLQAPDCLLFDEPESGVDLEHIAAVGAAVNRLVSKPSSTGGARGALLITHTGLILDHVRADVGHILVDGRIIHSGAPRALFQHIQQAGYTVPAA